jgi:hypothetical protein
VRRIEHIEASRKQVDQAIGIAYLLVRAGKQVGTLEAAAEVQSSWSSCVCVLSDRQMGSKTYNI